MGRDPRPVVVLAPEILAKSFLIEEHREVLQRWRDGSFRLGVTRELLVYYLQLLRRLGIPDSQLRQWSAWFTSPEKAFFVAEPGAPDAGVVELLIDAAARTGATRIVAGAVPGEQADGNWIALDSFLSS